MKRLLAVLLCVSLMLGGVSPALAQSGPTDGDGGTPAHRVFLPNVSSASHDEPVSSAQELVRQLNARYGPSGIEFFVLHPAIDGVLRAVDNSGKEVVFQDKDLLPFASPQELYDFLDSAFLPTSSQISDSSAGPEQSIHRQEEASTPLSLIPAWATISWYQFACGGGAYYLGGVFCWKNITYTYQIDDVQRRVLNPSVTGSYLSGVNFLYWTHLGGTAYMINSRAAYVNAFGYYTMGIQAFGLTIGATWSDSWSRVAYPPCAVCR